MKPDYPNHKNPALSAIFDAALPQVTEILAKWDNGHSAINSFEAFFLTKKKVFRRDLPSQFYLPIRSLWLSSPKPRRKRE
jgi:hypothetical protein